MNDEYPDWHLVSIPVEDLHDTDIKAWVKSKKLGPETYKCGFFTLLPLREQFWFKDARDAIEFKLRFG